MRATLPHRMTSIAAAWVLAVVLGLPQEAFAASPSADTIFTCTDGQGRKLTSDRLIPECMGREQRVLNRDGSVQRIIAPSMTADERAEFEAREQRRAADVKAQQEAVRRDRNLMQRFPSEAAHAKAREAALDDMRKAVQTSEARFKVLADERKPLMEEAEFYAGKTMPARLKALLDANDAATDAQRSLVQTQSAEIERINALYDTELARLRRLWAGATPGSLGSTPQPAAPPPTAASKSAKN